MTTPLVVAVSVVAYSVAGLVLVAVAARGEGSRLGEYGPLVVLAWPLVLALVLVERGFAPGPAPAPPHRRRLVADPAVGQVGVAVTDLRPTGRVAVTGTT